MDGQTEPKICHYANEVGQCMYLIGGRTQRIELLLTNHPLQTTSAKLKQLPKAIFIENSQGIKG
jgi:hypothetical protein